MTSRAASSRPGLNRRGLLMLGAGCALAPRAGFAQPAVTSRQVGINLYELVFSQRTGTVYVTSAGGRWPNAPKPQIFALDGTTLETRAVIEPEFAGFGLGLNDRTQTLFTTNTIDGNVSLIDLRTGRARATVKHGEKAHLREVVVDEAKNLAYVSEIGNSRAGTPSAVWVIDAARGRISHVLSEGVGEGGITGLALDAARNRLYATAMQSNEIVEIDLEARKAVRRFASGGESAINVALDAAGRRLFVTHQRSNELVALNAETGAVLGKVAVGDGALGVAFDPLRYRVLTANRRAGTLSVVDARSLTLIDTVATGTHPNTVAIDHASGNAYVSNKRPSGGRGNPPPEDPNGDTVSLVRF